MKPTLTHSDVVRWLERFQFGLQRVRSMASEVADEQTLICINPMIHAQDSVLLNAVSRMIERTEAGRAAITPMEFYNITYLLDLHGMEVDAWLLFHNNGIEHPDLDTVKNHLITGWKDEQTAPNSETESVPEGNIC